MGGVRYPRLSLLLYLGMGWLIVIAIRPLWLHVPLPGLLWLLLGGIAYTAGVGFFAAKHLRYGHFVWHLFVLAGTSCHFIAVRFYAARLVSVLAACAWWGGGAALMIAA